MGWLLVGWLVAGGLPGRDLAQHATAKRGRDDALRDQRGVPEEPNVPRSPRSEPLIEFEARVRSVRDATTVVLDDGRVVRVQGWSLPAESVRPAGFAEKLREFLRARVEGRSCRFVAEVENEPGDAVDHTARIWPTDGRDPQPRSVNEQGLAGGRALLSARTPRVRPLAALCRAATEAQRKRRGWFAVARARPAAIPYLNGAVVGLYHQDGRDYRRHLDELAEAGFRHVSLLFSVFVDHARSVRIDCESRRTPRDAVLLDTIRWARRHRMTVLVLPIVLLRNPREDDWRGTLRPADERAFFLAYDRMLCRYADIAQAGGADLFSVGSELGSLEDSTHAWRRMIAHARGRFTGWLTYSANWDHVHVPQFFDDLDLVGMTAYFELTESNEPGDAELRAAWRAEIAKLRPLSESLPKPVIFTELGYPSQDGANREPWNYQRNRDRIDLDEQAMCFRAFLDVVGDMPWLRGAYFYDYYDAGGPGDAGYSPRGKPAMAQWRRWAGWSPK